MTAAQIVRLNASALGIPVPAIVYVDPDEMPTPTTQAAVGTTDYEIAVNRSQLYRFRGRDGDLNLTLVLSHEMRHLWQLRSGWSPAASGYLSRSETSLAEYNAQQAEVDAWAWSVIVVEDLHGVTPQVGHILGADIVTQISNRAAEIRAERHLS